MVNQRDLPKEASMFAKASRACYAVVLFAAISLGWSVALSAFGLQVFPLSLLPAFFLSSCALLLLVLVFGFYTYKIGKAYDIRFLRISSILAGAASLALLIVFFPILVGVSLSFYQTLPSSLAGLTVLTILSAGVLLLISLFLFVRGIEDMKTKLYLRGLRVFRRAESVFFTTAVAYGLLAVISAPLLYSSSPAMAALGSQLWTSALVAIFGVGSIVLLILFAATLGKLAHPEILARAVDAAARAPPEPRLFGLPAKRKKTYELPKSVRESFQQVESDKKFEFSILGGKYLALKKGNIFMLVPEVAGGAYIAYFIKLFSQTPTTRKRFKAPLVFPRKKHFSQSIAGFPVAKFRGKFTLPVDIITKTEGSELKYASGPGVMYLVPRRDPSRGMYSLRAISPTEELTEKFDKTAILKIIDELSKETIEKGAAI